jgi:hypothetical protein
MSRWQLVRFEKSGMSFLGKILLSAVAVSVSFVSGVLIFMALPINWRTASIWVSWSAMLQNGVLAICVFAAIWVALRAIWKHRKTSDGSEPGAQQE